MGHEAARADGIEAHRFAIGLASVSCVILAIALGVVLRPFDPAQILHIQFTYSAPEFESVYRSWSELQRHRFDQHFAIDYAFLVSYGLLGYLLAMHYASPNVGRPLPFWSVCVPPAAAICDAMEDVLQQGLIDALSKGGAVDWLALCAGACATAKWLLVGLFLGLVAVRAVARR